MTAATGCPREACGHAEEDHFGIFSTLCGVDGCECGESEVLDARARSAIKRGGWSMAPDEAIRRGLVRMRDHTQPCADCDDGDGPTGLEEPPFDDACVTCAGHKVLGWPVWHHEDDGGCDIRDEQCADRNPGPDADDLPICLVWSEPREVWSCLPCYLRAHKLGCGCDLFAELADLSVMTPQPD